ncbi:hypothetical protein [Rossellomorea marisflavi]|uniref:hypothetical protein n=1 Tax=Rossellomorea marisflavi TaxID=189381 RepID=UPI0034577D44
MRMGMANNQVIEISLGGIEVFSIIASVISIVLGVVAIWLSIVFYKMSEKSSKEVERSSNAIDSNVQKLDALFDKMYSDTFGMVKDTVSDMRKYVYKEDSQSTNTNIVSTEIEKKAKNVVDQALLDFQGDSLSKMDVIKIVNDVVKKSTQVVEDFEKDNINYVMNILEKHNGKINYGLLITMLENEGKQINSFKVIDDMLAQDLILNPFHIRGGERVIFHSTDIVLKSMIK